MANTIISCIFRLFPYYEIRPAIKHHHNLTLFHTTLY